MGSLQSLPGIITLLMLHIKRKKSNIIPFLYLIVFPIIEQISPE
jgi:hypothetical protein